jgi:hypothetical protein
MHDPKSNLYLYRQNVLIKPGPGDTPQTYITITGPAIHLGHLDRALLLSFPLIPFAGTASAGYAVTETASDLSESIPAEPSSEVVSEIDRFAIDLPTGGASHDRLGIPPWYASREFPERYMSTSSAH